MTALALLALASLVAHADPNPVMAGDVLVTTLPASPLGVLQQDQTVWILTGGGDLQRWDADDGGYTLSSTRHFEGAAGLFDVGGRPWVEVHEVKALPAEAGVVAVASVATAEAATSEPTAPPAATTGTVLKAELGTALVDLGRDAGLSPGADLRFMGTEVVEVPLLDATGTELRTVARVAATGRVRVVEDDRALVDLDRGGRVAEGDAVEPHTRRSHYPVGPERLGGLGETGLSIRPLLALDTLGVGFINELWTSYTFEKPWYATVRVAPLAFGFSRDGNPLSVAGLASGGYDARYFSLGLGAGWSMLNGDASSWGRSYDYALQEGGGGQPTFPDVEGAFSVVQEARLGGRDGLNLTVRNTFVLVPRNDAVWNGSCGEYYYDYEHGSGEDCWDLDESTEFAYGGIAMTMNIPVGARTDLFVDWGTGGAGATWVESGVASWIRGNGDKGSLGISVAAGYGQLAANPNDEWVELYGPLVSLGARWRW
ncbi:MAG: hypothetical protein ABIO70_18055 [Pseudomonadota bacterium]